MGKSDEETSFCCQYRDSYSGRVAFSQVTSRAFSWLKAAATAFTFKTLLRHYALVGAMITNLHVDHHTITTLHPASGGQAGVTYTDQSAVTAPHIRSHSAVITFCSSHLILQSAVMSHSSAKTWLILWSHTLLISAQVRLEILRK